MLRYIRGELLYEDVIEAKDMEFGSLESGIMKINPQGPLNLLLGFLAHKLGLDYNMRMYFSEIEPKFKNSEGEYERSWRDDEGVGSLGKILIDLFPSHGGSLSVSSSSDTSFSTSLTKDGRDKGVKFMAALMVCSLDGKLECEEYLSNRNSFVRIGRFKIENLKKEAAERVTRIIEYFRKPDSITEKMGIIERFVKSKRFPLLSFTFMFLDSKEEMEDFLNTFFSLADKEVRDKCFIAKKDHKDDTNYELLSDIVNILKLFPFSELNPPPSNISVNAYSRNKDGGKGGFLNSRFSDCGEVSLLEFVCCVFFNPETLSYPIDRLEKASPDLKNFFSTRKSLFGFDMECRREWFKVVQDRRDGEGKHDTRINYVRKYSETGSEAEPDKKYSEEEDPRARNEVEPGLLNLLSILRSIWNTDDKNVAECKLLKKRSIESKPKEENEISKAIEDFKLAFEKMISIINSDEKSIDIEYDGLRIGIGLGENFWDIYGGIILTIGIKGVFEAKINLEHSEDHAETSIINTEFLEMLSLEESSKTLSNIPSSDNELDCLIRKYVIGCVSPPEDDEVLELIQENIYNGFSHGCLNNDDLRADVVKGLHNWLKGLNHKSDVYYEIHEIMSNIIANSTLSDYGVRENYGHFFFISKTLFERFFGFAKEDKEKTSYFLDAVKNNIGKSTTYSYLKKDYEFIFMNESYSTRLITDIMDNNRKDLFKIIEKNQKRKYSGLSAAKVHRFSKILQLHAEDLSYSFAERLLAIINKDEIMRNRPQVHFSREGLKELLQILKRSGGISRENQEKLFCYYFYAYNSDYYLSLEFLMEQTCDSPNFPMDFVSDCIVRRPDIYFCKLYEVLLKSALRRSKEENRIEFGEDAFAMIMHVVEFIYDDQNKDKLVEYMRPSAQKLNELLSEVQKEGLIRPVSFNKGKLMKLATGYLRSSRMKEDFERYFSEVNEVIKEGVASKAP